jgi:predicted HTH transcriptional regulator
MAQAAGHLILTLRISREHVAQGTLPDDEEKILAYVREHGRINNAKCRELLGIDLHRASYLLKRLAAEGELKREGERRWAHYRLP